jgi:hypothetical protein
LRLDLTSSDFILVARSIPKSYRNVTGRFASAKNRNPIGFESTLEKDFFLLLEFDRRVESFEEQPVTISYRNPEGRVCRYTPDVLVRYRPALASEPGEAPALCEVKYRDDLRAHGAEYRPKFTAARRYARDRGWRFRVVTEREIRTPRLTNIRFLLRYRRMRVDAADCDALLAALRAHGATTPDTLLGRVRLDPLRYAEALATLWHLVATEQIGVDLDRLLTPHSVLRPCADHADGGADPSVIPVLVNAGGDDDGPC